MFDGPTLWRTILDELALLLDKPTVATWFSQTKFVSLQNEHLTISAPNHYSQEFIHKRYLKLLQKLITQHLGPDGQLTIKVEPPASGSIKGPLFDHLPTQDLTDSRPKREDFVQPKPVPPADLRPNTHYTLDNFVVGNSNRVAHAAAMSVIENPGTSYNPLFVYGGTGVGKTHLLHAIGNELLQRDASKQVFYFTTEKLLNDFVESIQLKKGMSEFRARYRTCNAILVDDLQFMAKKEALQEEFYHTYNELFTNGKQIVLAADRLPKDIANLTERLISRFMGGLLVDMNQPDFETRLAILKAKSQALGFDLTTEELTLLAETLDQNVREIEGFLLKIKSAATAQDLPVTLGLIKDLLSDKEVTRRSKKLTPELILSAVTETYDTTIADLCGRKRRREVVLPRQVAMFLLRNEVGLNLVEIGEILGGRDHSTVIHGIDKISQRLSNHDRYLGGNLRLIRSQLYD